MALKLFIDAMSQPSRSVMLLLKCNDIKHTIVLTDIAKGLNREPEFLKKSPNGLVPTLEDNGFCLFESEAIMRYICNNYTVSNNWYPQDKHRRAKIDEYLSWHHTNLRMGASMTFRTLFLIPKLTGKPVNREAAKKYIALFGKSVETFENYFLTNTNFISSNEMSIADLQAITEFSQLEILGNEAPPVTPKVAQWLERCREVTEPHYTNVHKIHSKVKSINLGSKL